MNRIPVLLVFTLLFSSCGTRTLIRREDGAVVADHQNLKRTQEPTKYEVSFEKASEGTQSLLKVTIIRKDAIREDWEDIYSTIGVYESQGFGCKSLIARIFTAYFEPAGTNPDINQTCQSLENDRDVTRKAKSRIVETESPVETDTITLTINKKALSSKFSNGTANFNLATLHVTSENLPHDVMVSIDFKDKHLDVSGQFATFVETETNRKIAQAEEEAKVKASAQAEQLNTTCNEGKPGACLKLAMLLKKTDRLCDRPNLYEVLAFNQGASAIDSGCIYNLQGPFKVLQVANGGILVSMNSPDPYMASKVLFIRTNRKYVDEDFVGGMQVHSVGTMTYSTVIGAQKTIHAFQDLDLANGRATRKNDLSSNYQD